MKQEKIRAAARSKSKSKKQLKILHLGFRGQNTHSIWLRTRRNVLLKTWIFRSIQDGNSFIRLGSKG